MQPACCLLQSHHSLPGRKIYQLNLTSIHLLPKPTLIFYCKWALIGRTSRSWRACVSILVWDVCWRIGIFDNEWLFCKVRGFLLQKIQDKNLYFFKISNILVKWKGKFIYFLKFSGEKTPMLSIYWDQREASLIIYCRQYHHFYFKY